MNNWIRGLPVSHSLITNAINIVWCCLKNCRRGEINDVDLAVDEGGERKDSERFPFVCCKRGVQGIAGGKSSNNISHDCTAVGGGHVRLWRPYATRILLPFRSLHAGARTTPSASYHITTHDFSNCRRQVTLSDTGSRCFYMPPLSQSRR